MPSLVRPAETAELRAFQAVAEERSFRRAGGRLGLAPSTLSHSVRALEERLGVRLLNRTTRSVAPTQAGLVLLAGLAPAFHALDAAVEAVNAFRAGPQGLVRLSVPQAAATMVLAPRLAGFAAAFPDVTLEIIVDDRFVDMVREGFDAGIRLGEAMERDMVAVRLTPDLRGAAVASPAYFAVHPAPRSPWDLADHRCINRRLVGSGRLYAWTLGQGAERVEVAVDGPLITNDEPLMLAAALGGGGVAFLSEHDVGPHLASGALVRVLEDWSATIPGFFLYHPRNRQGSASLRALVETLTEPGT